MMAMRLTAIKGSDFTDISSSVTWAMPDEMNMFSPSGGVEKPRDRQQMRMMPKWIGSTPRATMTGSSTGVTIMMIAKVSMNMPMNTKNITTRIQIMVRFVVKFNKPSAIMSGILY